MTRHTSGRKLEQRGFRQLACTLCTFFQNGLLVVAHSDNFLVPRKPGDLESLVDDLLQSVTRQMVDLGENTEFKFLGRTISRKSDGLEWEGDTRHSTTFNSKLNWSSAVSSRKRPHAGCQEIRLQHGGTIRTQTSDIDICGSLPWTCCSRLTSRP